MDKLKTDLPDVKANIESSLNSVEQKVQTVALPDDFNIYSGGHYENERFVYDNPIGPVRQNHASKFYHSKIVGCTGDSNCMYIHMVCDKVTEGNKMFCDSHGYDVCLIMKPSIPMWCPKEAIDEMYKPY